jgi:hypothetical protein
MQLPHQRVDGELLRIGQTLFQVLSLSTFQDVELGLRERRLPQYFVEERQHIGQRLAFGLQCEGDLGFFARGRQAGAELIEAIS